jgi:hypothetical protein
MQGSPREPCFFLCPDGSIARRACLDCSPKSSVSLNFTWEIPAIINSTSGSTTDLQKPSRFPSKSENRAMQKAYFRLAEMDFKRTNPFFDMTIRFFSQSSESAL